MRVAEEHQMGVFGIILHFAKAALVVENIRNRERQKMREMMHQMLKELRVDDGEEEK